MKCEWGRGSRGGPPPAPSPPVRPQVTACIPWGRGPRQSVANPAGTTAEKESIYTQVYALLYPVARGFVKEAKTATEQKIANSLLKQI